MLHNVCSRVACASSRRSSSILKVTFTGSVATGKAIAASCTKMCKRFTLELGGNDAAIVREDCDMDKAAKGIFNGAFGNSGQVHHGTVLTLLFCCDGVGCGRC